MPEKPRVPTINDLRVKLCYICREEEQFDAEPESPPRAWTHPCQCTLVAHETCLLKWIQTSQANQRPSKGMKCPQCSAKYELVSRDSSLLRGLSLGNRSLQRVGRFVTAVGVIGFVCVEILGVYVLCTGYGAWAVNQFIGNEMFDILFTDDPSNWPWTAFLNFPLIPLSLIISRFTSNSSLGAATIPLLVWPATNAVLPNRHLLNDLWSSSASNGILGANDLSHVQRWPPSPVLFTFFVVPAVRLVYRAAMDKLALWMLGTKVADSTGTRQRGGRRPEGGGAENGNANNALGGGGLQFNEGFFQIRIRAVDEGQEGEDEGQGGGEDMAAAMENQDPDAVAVAAAQQLINADASSLGRKFGGALILPSVSSFMGSLLFRLVKHSHLLRRFLGIRPHPVTKSLLRQTLFAPLIRERDWASMGTLRQVGEGLKVVGQAFWNGSRVWTEVDPVWWRNSVGLGLFFVAKDCIELLHLYLAKRELESRKVKNRDFSGVDIKELDLVPSFLRPSAPPATTTTTS